MLFDQRIRRVAGRTSFGLVMLAAGAAALAASRPAAVAAAIGAVEKAVACNSPSPCSTTSNSGKGSAINGTSAKGTGIYGSGQAYGVEGFSARMTGVFGASNGFAGVYGSSPAGWGVYGLNQSEVSGAGVYGSSPSVGVYGTATADGGAAIQGYANNNGTGVFGDSESGYALEGITDEGYGVVAQAYDQGNGVYVSVDGPGYGLSSYTNGGLAIYGNNSNGIGSDLEGSYIGIVGRAPASGGYPMVLTDSNENDVFYVDGVGDVYYSGGLINFARVKGGGSIKSFSAKTTSPTVEDTGTAELVNGVAQVRLDPTFAASIDSKTAYRVFVTPGGDTRGLFVATKSPSGFVVRESQAGRSTVTFDYRIVATALGQAGQRMAFVNGSGPRAAAAVIPRLKVAKRKPPTKP
ncbi:MAG: hypothetical protein IAI50_09390 [Candidatus Eremiobacteraeota bacterium]|nr:hypothetical protein [Candidatus Eremiobacteraeota bacterium]